MSNLIDFCAQVKDTLYNIHSIYDELGLAASEKCAREKRVSDCHNISYAKNEVLETVHNAMDLELQHILKYELRHHASNEC